MIFPLPILDLETTRTLSQEDYSRWRCLLPANNFIAVHSHHAAANGVDTYSFSCALKSFILSRAIFFKLCNEFSARTVPSSVRFSKP